MGIGRTREREGERKVMISMKSKFKVLYPFLISEFVLTFPVGYLSTIIQPPYLKSFVEGLSISFILVFWLQVFIILFSSKDKEKFGFFTPAIFSLEQIFMLIMPESYKRAIALDKEKEENGI